MVYIETFIATSFQVLWIHFILIRVRGRDQAVILKGDLDSALCFDQIQNLPGVSFGSGFGSSWTFVLDPDSELK